MKKIVATILAIICVLGTAACGPIGTNGGGVDSSQTTLIKVKNYNGGVGRQWLDDAAARFTEANKNVSFADGKTGVAIEITDGDTMTSTIKNESYHVHITSGAGMDVTESAQLGSLYDLTDLVTDESREGGSLDSLIFDDVKEAFMYNGKYYGLPHYSLSNGVSYDRDLFDSQLLYFADENEWDVVEYTGINIKITGRFIASKDAKKSVGLDGIENTEDDGLPRSLEEFILLMDYIKNGKSDQNISPIMVSGKYTNYIQYFLQGFTSTLAGAEQMKNYYNCSGEIEIVDGYTDEDLFPGINYIKKPIVKKVVLSEADKNGYLGMQLAAKYYAMSVIEIIQREKYFAKEVYNSMIDHYSAQKCLIYGGAATGYDKVAMLIEGSYWFNEAKKSGVLDSYVTITGDKNERNVSWMSLPTSVYTKDIEIGVSPIFTFVGAQIVINANIKGNTELETAALEFVKFLYTNEELASFTVETGCTRNLEYYLTEEQINSMPTFYQSFWKSRKEDGSNTSIEYASTKTGRKVASYTSLGLNSEMWNYWNLYHLVNETKNTVQMFEDMKRTAEEWARIVDA